MVRFTATTVLNCLLFVSYRQTCVYLCTVQFSRQQGSPAIDVDWTVSSSVAQSH